MKQLSIGILLGLTTTLVACASTQETQTASAPKSVATSPCSGLTGNDKVICEHRAKAEELLATCMKMKKGFAR